MLDKFIRRLKALGIDVELSGNIPWIYLKSVNGTLVGEKFYGNHGFTAFFLTKDGTVKFSDRRKVFQIVRKLI